MRIFRFRSFSKEGIWNDYDYRTIFEFQPIQCHAENKNEIYKFSVRKSDLSSYKHVRYFHASGKFCWFLFLACHICIWTGRNETLIKVWEAINMKNTSTYWHGLWTINYIGLGHLFLVLTINMFKLSIYILYTCISVFMNISVCLSHSHSQLLSLSLSLSSLFCLQKQPQKNYPLPFETKKKYTIKSKVDLPEIKGNHRKFRTLVSSYIGNHHCEIKNFPHKI